MASTLTQTITYDDDSPSYLKTPSVRRFIMNNYIACGAVPSTITLFTPSPGYVVMIDTIDRMSSNVNVLRAFLDDSGVDKLGIIMPNVNVFAPAVTYTGGVAFYGTITYPVGNMEANKDLNLLIYGRLIPTTLISGLTKV
jgi:hypothetical protein